MIRLGALLLLMTGCDYLFQLEHHDVPVDAELADAPLGTWGPPVPLASLNLNTGGDTTFPFETDASMTEDGLDIFFSSDRGVTTTPQVYDIYEATRPNTSVAFGEPVLRTDLSTSMSETGFITSDGLTFYRKVGSENFITRATRTDRGAQFSASSKIDGLSQVPGGTNIELSGDGLHAVVNVLTSPNDQELYIMSRTDPMGAWSGPVRQMGLSSPVADGAGSFDQQALMIVFHTDRESGVRKLYYSTRDRADMMFQFDRTFPITELDDAPSSDPWLSPDRRTLIFTRDGDLYMSRR